MNEIIKLSCLFFVLFLFSCGEDPDDKLPQFKNMINESGIRLEGGFGQTASWGDYDNDNFLDIAVGSANFGRGSINVYIYKNDGDGTFSNKTDELGVTQIALVSSVWADINNNGFPDLILATNRSYEPTRVYLNQNANRFKESSEELGLLIVPGSNKHNVLADYNNDGLLDVLEVSFGTPFLFENKGDGSFTNVSDEVGLGKQDKYQSALWFDYNNDGLKDLFVANNGTNSLFQNTGQGKFKDMSETSGLEGHFTWDTVSSCAGDYNGDGFLDLYIGNISSFRNSLYKNNGDGTFTDVTFESGTPDVGDARTCAWVDFNGDGLLDIFTTNHLSLNKLYLNKDNGKFVDVAPEVGIEKPLDVFAATWGDYNNDGFIDVFLNGHLGRALMRNEGNDNHNIIVKLIGDGKNTNISAIGSIVEVKTGSKKQVREVSGGRGCCDQDMLPVHFGVGRNNEADIHVKWTDGSVCEFKDIKIEKNKFLTVEQGECKLSDTFTN